MNIAKKKEILVEVEMDDFILNDSDISFLASILMEAAKEKREMRMLGSA